MACHYDLKTAVHRSFPPFKDSQPLRYFSFLLDPLRAMMLPDGESIPSILAGSLILSLFLATQVRAQQLGSAGDTIQVTREMDTGSLLIPKKEQRFGSRQIITTDADEAWAVYASDLDGDGDQDVLSASFADDKISWYENDGSGSFSDQSVITYNADGAFDVYTADLDGDGDQDILSASSWDDKIAWYENNGSGSFSDQKVITYNADGAFSVYAADLDGDGDEDVMAASWIGDKITWYENIGGNGTFSDQNLVANDFEKAEDVYAADLDGDGDRDLLTTAEGDDIVAWHENDGSGSFSSQRVITTDIIGGERIHAEDLDGDGDKDVLSASDGDDKIAWYENDGTGSFSEQKVITTAAIGATSVYTADADEDGDPDVFSASRVDDKVAWYENEESSSFSSQKVITSNADGADEVYAADLDGDSDVDVLSSSKFDDTVSWYENQGDGSNGPISVSIEGTRLTSQTLPSEENTPEDEVPYPPDTKDIRDQIEVVRYPADRVALRARVRLEDSFDGSVEDVSVEGTLDGETMQTVIRDSVDTDEDGEIDTLPFDHYRTGEGTEYADVLLISSQELDNGAENLSLDVTATTASGAESQASEEVSLYYAEREGDGRPFDPQTDGYRFENLEGLSFGEVTNLLKGYGLAAGGYLALYGHLDLYNGRCFGMAGTAGIYFDEPNKKVFSGETYQQPESDTEMRKKIAEYHLAQDYSGINNRLSNPDLSLAYSKAKVILEEYGETPMIGVEYGSAPSRHAVLATNITVLQKSNEGVFEVNDSNIPGTTYDLSYDLSSAEVNASISEIYPSYMDVITAIATVNVDGVPFLPDGDWYRSVLADYIDGVGKMFGATFTSSGKNSQASFPATNENSEWETTRVLVKNGQGQQSGYLADGTKVNEIGGAVVKQVVTDSSAGEKASYVTVPPGETYTSSITTSTAGEVRFEHAVPTDNSKAEVNYAEGISFTDESSGTYDETDKQIKLDEDGDGTVDKTISTESSTLPVELTSFGAYAEGGDMVVLTWRTASEQNNAGFEVQHQPSGSERWRSLGFVDSKAPGGTTTETKTYRYAAEDLVVGTHRFRLKQKDLDGSTTITDPVTVQLQMQEALKFPPPSPNPASKTATLAFAVKERTKANVTVYNTLGQRVKMLYDGAPPAGESQRIRLDASDLSSGTYFIRLKAGDKIRTQRLTVVR